MQKNQLVYGIVGALFGGLFVWLITVSSFSGRMNGMMGMQRQQNNIPSQPNSAMMGDMDKQFIEQMIPHHEDAIAMAKLALEKSQRSEIKELANTIIKTQSEEVTNMRIWYKDWYGTDVPKNTMDMRGGMMNNSMDSDSLADAVDFDKEFLTQMTMHHRMAVMMVRMMLGGTNRPEMEQLGKEIIDAQTKEINQMQAWYQSWYL